MHPLHCALLFCTLLLTLCPVSAQEPEGTHVQERFTHAEPASDAVASKIAAELCLQAFLGSDAHEAAPAFGRPQVKLSTQDGHRIWRVALPVSRAGTATGSSRTLLTRCVITSSSGLMLVSSLTPARQTGP